MSFGNKSQRLLALWAIACAVTWIASGAVSPCEASITLAQVAEFTLDDCAVSEPGSGATNPRQPNDPPAPDLGTPFFGGGGTSLCAKEGYVIYIDFANCDLKADSC